MIDRSTSLTETDRLEIQLEFIEPFYVSQGINELDILSVKVLPKMLEQERVSSYSQTYKDEVTGEA